jgi:hypothetical protein
MNSEWMKVMLEEIARKRAEAEQAQSELQRRREDRGAPPPAAPPIGPPSTAPSPRSEDDSR